MTKPIYEWVWKRAKGKHFLALLKDGKKIGAAREKFRLEICECCGTPMYELYPLEYPEGATKPRYVAYKGGGAIGGLHMTMTDAKIAVEKALGVSTMKDKKAKEPELIEQKGK